MAFEQSALLCECEGVQLALRKMTSCSCLNLHYQLHQLSVLLAYNHVLSSAVSFLESFFPSYDYINHQLLFVARLCERHNPLLLGERNRPLISFSQIDHNQ